MERVREPPLAGVPLRGRRRRPCRSRTPPRRSSWASPRRCSSAGGPTRRRRRSTGGARSWGRKGRAASGWRATLEAASDARIELLLFREGAEHEAKRCPACGRLSLDGAKCPLDGTQLEPSQDGLDLAVHQTLAHGGRVGERNRDDLEAGRDGIGALLRF